MVLRRARRVQRCPLDLLFMLCSYAVMQHALTLPASALAAPRRATEASPFRFELARPEPAWREAMRWSLIGLSASLAAGELLLLLAGP
jgi:hypothetical protein